MEKAGSTLPTAEFRKWLEGTEFQDLVGRVSHRLTAKFGVGQDANNYWDLYQEIAARAAEHFRAGDRPLDAAKTEWLMKLAYRAASDFAKEVKRAMAPRSIEEGAIQERGRPPEKLAAVVSDERTRFTREYMKARGAEFYANEIGRLPALFAQAILLVDVEGKALKEAAKIAGVPYRTMVSRHQAGRKLLAKRLGEYLDNMTREI